MKSWLKPSQLTLEKKGRGSQAGYTIVETLIVLAVTSLMFVAIMLVFNGRQARVEFSQAVRDYESFLESQINEVENGHYDTLGRCIVNNPSQNNSTPRVNPSTPPTEQGTNEQCMFIGRAYGRGDYSTGIPGTIDDTVTSIFGVVGRSTVSIRPPNSDQRLANSLLETIPVLSTDTGGMGNIERSENLYNHSFRLRLTKMVSLDDAPPTYLRRNLNNGNVTTINIDPFDESIAVAFFNDVNGTSGGDSLVRAYYLPQSALDQIVGNGEEPKIYDMQLARKGLKLCFRGQNDQRAEIDIGESNGQVNIISTLGTPDVGGLCNA